MGSTKEYPPPIKEYASWVGGPPFAYNGKWYMRQTILKLNDEYLKCANSYDDEPTWPYVVYMGKQGDRAML